VIFTGAQRHAAHPDSDGPATLRAAVVLAAGPRLRGAGVLVAMNGLVDAARCARKVHGRATGAFGGGEPDASPNWAPRAFDSSNCRSAVPRCRVRCDRTCRARRTGRGDNVLVLAAAPHAAARAIVLDAFGLGNAHLAVASRVGAAVAADVPVLVCFAVRRRRCGAGLRQRRRRRPRGRRRDARRGAPRAQGSHHADGRPRRDRFDRERAGARAGAPLTGAARRTLAAARPRRLALVSSRRLIESGVRFSSPR
jgi:hypothetical protein